jgi:PhzF family phenazine biosynthesis protein
MRIALFHVDAFASRPFSGNPAAICFLDSWLDDGSLHKVAAENNLSATAYLVKRGGGYEIRWFTARREIKLCGHATLGAAFVILSLLETSMDTVEFETRYSGLLHVEKTGELLQMNFPSLFTQRSANEPPLLIKGLGSDSSPAEILEGNERFIAVFDSREMVEDLQPDFGLLEQLHPFVVGVTAPGEEEDFVSRYFAPSYGTPEDPVTGSLHCALTPYWSKRLGKSALHARQLSERGGELWCEMSGDRVIVKGNAVLVRQASLTI